MAQTFIYLASQSPRRAAVLAQLGISFSVLTPVDKTHSDALEALEAPLENERAQPYVKRVTALKLGAALQRIFKDDLPPAPVLCADTTVDLSGTILGKPKDAKHARSMLRALSGQRHRVLTATAVGTLQGHDRIALSISHVTFAPLSARTITAYIDSGEWQGKAGSYAIQGLAGAFVKHMSGSYSAIMGLPIRETALLLREVGLDVCV